MFMKPATKQEKQTATVRKLKAAPKLWQCPHCKRFGHIKRPGDVVKLELGGPPC